MTETVYPWNELAPAIRGENITIKILGASGRVWNIAGLDMGIQGAWIAGPIDGMVHVPSKGVWTKPAYGPPRFERTVDDRREITTQIAIASPDSALGWYDVESKFWNDVNSETPCYWSITTRRYGEMWLPMQLLETIKTPLDDDPTRPGNRNVQIWDIKLASDGDPRWRMPDCSPPPYVNAGNNKKFIRAVNRGTKPAWPVYIVSAPGKVFLPDGPNAVFTDTTDMGHDLNSLLGLFGFTIPGGKRRDATMIEVPELLPGEHAVIDTDPSHRIAISAIDPVDNILKQFVRNSELLDWILGQYGDTGLPLLQRFKGQGFSIPIPPRSTVTLPVSHSHAGGKIWVRIPQRFERAISA